MTKILFVERLELNNFRNYYNTKIDFEPKPVIITGPNGIGKTNILEAISFLAPGKGFRGTKLKEIDNKNSLTNSPWKIKAIINSTVGKTLIETGRVNQNNDNSDKRIVKIDEVVSKTKSDLSTIFSVVWLIPQMDQLFIASSSDRRKFFDRLVYNFDSKHLIHLAKYEHYMRERLKLIKSLNYDNNWLSIIESNMAKFSVVIASSRNQTLEYLQESIEETITAFPKAKLKLKNEIEEMLNNEIPAIKIEEYIKEKLYENRKLDFLTNKTNIGAHKTDFTAYHIGKELPVNLCSTGEQKALLISIILAEAKARIKWKKSTPVLLFDEIIAHLDKKRRSALFNEILFMKSQCWITGTDQSLFSELANNAQYFSLNNTVS